MILPVSVCQQTDVANPDKPWRQDMQEEPSDELLGRERHRLLFVPVRIVPPSEGHSSVLEVQDTVVADSDSVGIPAQVLEDTLGPARVLYSRRPISC